MAPHSNHVSYTTLTENINTHKQLDHVTAIPASRPDSIKFAASSAPRIACIVDLDNLCSRRGQHGRRAWAHLDVVAFTAAIRDRGATKGIVFQNQNAGEFGLKLWSAGGLGCVATGINVDPLVKLAAVDYAFAGLDCLILVASDGGYDEVIHAIRRCGVRVELWALRAAVARHLVYAADAVRWIDDLVREPEVNGHSGGPTATHMAA